MKFLTGALLGESLNRRSPRGERGLKCVSSLIHEKSFKSLSSRRAWIEMLISLSHIALKKRRSPRGERGLKCVSSLIHEKSFSRSPRGERGLKSMQQTKLQAQSKSLSSRRAWIEIQLDSLSRRELERVALLAESVD